MTLPIGATRIDPLIYDPPTNTNRGIPKQQAAERLEGRYGTLIGRVIFKQLQIYEIGRII